MKLSTFIERFSAAYLARALRVTPSFVAQIKAGAEKGRPVPIKRCVQIEAATFGLVSRQELRPDWREIWPELEAMERAAATTRAARRFSRRSDATGYALADLLQNQAPHPAGPRRLSARSNSFQKKSHMRDLLLSSMTVFSSAVCRTRPNHSRIPPFEVRQ